MDTIFAKYAAQNVPRYTSYPTAPQFSDAVDGDTVGGWLDAVNADAGLSIYLHVPYCRALCAYCGCHTKITASDAPLVDCALSLRDEIAVVRDHLGRPLTVKHLHWGGGTPSLLPADQFHAILGDLQDAFVFGEEVEHAIEIDPRSVTPDLVDLLVDLGVNRVSLGVQDFDARVQQAIGRIQPFEMVAHTVDLLRTAGIEAINFDLIYGLPRQTRAGIVRTAHLAADLKPSRIALYGYAHVPWFKTHQRLIVEAELPGRTERMDLEAATRSAFEERGFVAIGLDHFAWPDDELAIAAQHGRLHRNFQGYTTDEAEVLIGLGASSISRYPQGYAQNAPDIAGWRRSIDGGRLATRRGYAFRRDDRLRAQIIEDLMTRFAADMSSLLSDQPEAWAQLQPRLDELRVDGVIDVTGSQISVREPYRPLVRVVAAVFDAFHQQAPSRHSVAV